MGRLLNLQGRVAPPPADALLLCEMQSRVLRRTFLVQRRGAECRAPDNRLQGMRGRPCFRRRQACAPAPQPLTPVTLDAKETP